MFPKNDVKTRGRHNGMRSRILRGQRDLFHTSRRSRFQEEGEISRDEGRECQPAWRKKVF
jgi:hypothetical protein